MLSKSKLSGLKKKLQKRAVKGEASLDEVGRITNDTVAQHREQVLSAGKRFKYPLQHSKRKIVTVSILIIVAGTVLFSFFTWWELYKSQATGTFIYRVASLAPFPVARVDGTWVNYGDYLTLLRSSMHYLVTQEGVDFQTTDGQRQLDNLRTRALGQSIQYAYVQKLASQDHITVSDQEVNQEVNQIINQQAYSGSQQLYANVISQYYGLTFSQWEHSLRLQLLENKVYAAIDMNAQQRARSVLSQLLAGGSFATLAQKYSDDITHKASGGVIGTLQKGKADLPPELESALFSLKQGQYSNIIASQQGLFILDAVAVNGDQTEAADIFFQYTAFQNMLNQLQSEHKIDVYIPVKPDLSSNVSQN